jgi:hypothetical protein
VRIFFALAAIVIAAGCRRSENADRRGDTTVTPPVSIDTASRSEALTCGVTGKAVIGDDGVGELRVGRSVEDIRQSCEVISDSEEQGSEGMNERVLVVRIAGEPVRAVVTDNKVWRVEITSPRITTADSLGVDTPLRIIAAKRGARFHPGEDGVYGFVADHCALSFRFDVPLRPPRGSQWTPEAIDKAHGDAAVNKVLVTQCQR